MVGMTDQRLAVIVLAAGAGTRMKSRTPKVLHSIAGTPLIGHVLATAQALDPAHIVAVVRHERERVAAGQHDLPDPRILRDVGESGLQFGLAQRPEPARTDHLPSEAEAAIDGTDVQRDEERRWQLEEERW